MNVILSHQPSFAVATLQLAPGETARAESGAMLAMSAGITIDTSAPGGVFKSISRTMFGSESFFMNTFSAGPQGGWIQVAPTLPGDVTTIEFDGSVGWLMQSGSYLASVPSIEVETSWGGAKTFFGGEGLVMLRCSGVGTMVGSSFGAIDHFLLQPGQSLVVDSGHLVAFQESIDYQVRKVGGWKSTILSGEGLVVDMTGPGEVLTQTRNTPGFIDWVRSLVPTGQ